jgi:hypothetical protein
LARSRRKYEILGLASFPVFGTFSGQAHGS